jgi:hypothetical protein
MKPQAASFPKVRLSGNCETRFPCTQGLVFSAHHGCLVLLCEGIWPFLDLSWGCDSGSTGFLGAIFVVYAAAQSDSRPIPLWSEPLKLHEL